MARPSANAKLEKVKDMMGKKPDHEVAAAVGVSVSTVGKYRRLHKIPAYEGHKFVKGKVGTPGKPTSAPSRKKGASADKKKSPATGGKRRFRRSKLDAYANLIGKVPDREVAELAGMTPDGVRMYRHRHGIPAVSVFKKAQRKLKASSGAAPAPEAEAAPNTGDRAYTVSIRADGQDRDYVVLGSDIADAARRAVGALSARGSGEVLSLSFLAETLP